MEKLPVIFRVDLADECEIVTAVFPTLPFSPGFFTVYTREEQHGSGCPEWFLNTRPARQSEYESLLKHLETIYSREGDPEAVKLEPAPSITDQHRKAFIANSR